MNKRQTKLTLDKTTLKALKSLHVSATLKAGLLIADEPDPTCATTGVPTHTLGGPH